jgi:hypothetical protein
MPREKGAQKMIGLIAKIILSVIGFYFLSLLARVFKFFRLDGPVGKPTKKRTKKRKRKTWDK